MTLVAIASPKDQGKKQQQQDQYKPKHKTDPESIGAVSIITVVVVVVVNVVGRMTVFVAVSVGSFS